MSERSFYLDFERPIVELEKRIEEMQTQAETDGLDLSLSLLDGDPVVQVADDGPYPRRAHIRGGELVAAPRVDAVGPGQGQPLPHDGIGEAAHGRGQYRRTTPTVTLARYPFRVDGRVLGEGTEGGQDVEGARG